MAITWTDEPLEDEIAVTRRELDALEWAEQVEAWEQDDRDRVEAHE